MAVSSVYISDRGASMVEWMDVANSNSCHNIPIFT